MRIVTKLTAAAVIIAGIDIVNFKGTLSYITFPKLLATILITIPIPQMPATTPIGIPTVPIQSPSNITEFLSCFAVAPTDERIPN